MRRKLLLSEVKDHSSAGNCWTVIHGKVYNVTSFLGQHPGGKRVLLQNAGKDATLDFDSVHPVEILDEYLNEDQCVGEILVEPGPAKQDSATIKVHEQKLMQLSTKALHKAIPPVSHMLSIAEIECYAMQSLSPKAISYYASATDDEISKASNGAIYRSILLRPRVFVDCIEVSLSTTILGNKVGLPIFVAPAAMARLAHPSGEAGIATACAGFNALQIISKNASLSPRDIVRAGSPGAVFAWQLYVLKDIVATERTLAQIRAIPEIKFIVLTLDAPFPGKREADERFKMAEVAGGAAPQVWGTEAGLTWQKTLAWLVTQTQLPIMLKGVQTHEDAYAATLFPAVKGIILSNHGGRALDTAPPPMQVLLEIRRFCPVILEKLDVLVDGGVKRGTDVVKALALGAKGVGIGRAALYGLAIEGENGIKRTLQILADETATALRLLGVKNVAELRPRHVNTSALKTRLFEGRSDLDVIDQLLRSKL